MKNLPNIKLPNRNYAYKDYLQTTLDYIDFVTNKNNIYESANNETNGYLENYRTRKMARYLKSANMEDFFKTKDNISFGLPSYIGSKQADDEIGEAINILSMVLSGLLVGLDMSNYKSFDYLKSCVHFYSSEFKIVLNSKRTKESLWYIFYAGYLFCNIALLSKKSYLEEIVLNNAITTLEVVKKMNFDFNYQGFDFEENKPFKGNHFEQEGAVGAAYNMYVALLINKKHRKYSLDIEGEMKDAIIKCMDTYCNINISPLYEILGYIAPYFASILNEEYKTNYDIKKLIIFTVDKKRVSRIGWGMSLGNYYKKYAVGLLGSITDGKGYAFVMNTFAYALGMFPLVLHTKDRDIINFVAKWGLASSVSSRLFYPEANSFEYKSISNGQQTILHGKEQSGVWIKENSKAKYFIAYEGLRKKCRYVYYNGAKRFTKFKNTGPYASGDSYTFNWNGHTDYGLYGSSHVGIFGGVINKTDITGIIKINLTKLDFLNTNKKNKYLIYNPLKCAVEIDGNYIPKNKYVIIEG